MLLYYSFPATVSLLSTTCTWTLQIPFMLEYTHSTHKGTNGTALHWHSTCQCKTVAQQHVPALMWQRTYRKIHTVHMYYVYIGKYCNKITSFVLKNLNSLKTIRSKLQTTNDVTSSHIRLSDDHQCFWCSWKKLPPSINMQNNRGLHVWQLLGRRDENLLLCPGGLLDLRLLTNFILRQCTHWEWNQKCL